MEKKGKQNFFFSPSLLSGSLTWFSSFLFIIVKNKIDVVFILFSLIVDIMDEIVNQNETSTMSTTSTSTTTTTTSNYSQLKCQCYRLYIETMSMEIDQKLLDRLNRQQLQKRRTAIELLRQNDFNEIQKSLLTIDNLSNIDPIENDRSLQMLTTIGKSLNSMLTMIDLAIVDNINQQTTNINDNNNFQHRQQQQQQQKELDERLELISQFGDNDDYDNNDDYSQISSMLNMNNNNKPMDCRSVDNNLDHLNDNHNNISMSMSNLNIATTNRVNSALLSFDELSNNHHDNYPGHSNVSECLEERKIIFQFFFIFRVFPLPPSPIMGIIELHHQHLHHLYHHHHYYHLHHLDKILFILKIYKIPHQILIQWQFFYHQDSIKNSHQQQPQHYNRTTKTINQRQ